MSVDPNTRVLEAALLLLSGSRPDWKRAIWVPDESVEDVGEIWIQRNSTARGYVIYAVGCGPRKPLSLRGALRLWWESK